MAKIKILRFEIIQSSENIKIFKIDKNEYSIELEHWRTFSINKNIREHFL